MTLYTVALVACRSSVRGSAISKEPVSCSGPILAPDQETACAYANNRCLELYPHRLGYTDHQIHVTAVPNVHVQTAALALGMVEGETVESLRRAVVSLREENERIRRKRGREREGYDAGAFVEIGESR